MVCHFCINGEAFLNKRVLMKTIKSTWEHTKQEPGVQDGQEEGRQAS